MKREEEEEGEGDECACQTKRSAGAGARVHAGRHAGSTRRGNPNDIAAKRFQEENYVGRWSAPERLEWRTGKAFRWVMPRERMRIDARFSELSGINKGGDSARVHAMARDGRLRDGASSLLGLARYRVVKRMRACMANRAARRGSAPTTGRSTAGPQWATTATTLLPSSSPRRTHSLESPRLSRSPFGVRHGRFVKPRDYSFSRLRPWVRPHA